MRISIFLSIITTILLITTISSTNAQETAEIYKGHVVSVADGDTVTILLTDKTELKIRLAEIDAPEKAQPYGMKSKQALSDLIFDRDVIVIKEVIDKYGRTVGRIYHGAVDVNGEMVRRGAAWAYLKYLTDQSILDAEQQAKAKKLGLWALQADQRTPPWEWRKARRAANASKKRDKGKSKATPAKKTNNSSFKCGTKKTCSKMTSCKEAMFFLKNCHLPQLDRDEDGVPCEALCQ